MYTYEQIKNPMKIVIDNVEWRHRFQTSEGLMVTIFLDHLNRHNKKGLSRGKRKQSKHFFSSKYDQFFFTEQLFTEITFCLAISWFNAHKASHVVCCRLIILNIINIFTLTNCIQIWISPFQLEVQRLNYCENKRRMLTQWRHDYFSGNALVDSNEQHTTT